MYFGFGICGSRLENSFDRIYGPALIAWARLSWKTRLWCSNQVWARDEQDKNIGVVIPVLSGIILVALPSLASLTRTFVTFK